MKLHNFLHPALVVTDLETDGVESTLETLVRALAENERVDDEDAVLDALLEREAVQSTGIGDGMAIPHAVCAHLDDVVVQLGISPNGVDFNALDGQPVHVFFLLLSPPAHSGTHIKLLARIARLVRQPGFVEDLLDAPTGGEAIARIRRLDEQQV